MRTIIIILLTLFCSSLIVNGQEITGKWYGTLEIGTSKLRLVFNITSSGDTFSSTMDSPDQGAKNIPTTNTTFINNKLKITASNMRMTYEATLEDGTLKGTFTQGISAPLTLNREKQELHRPQTPIAPFPYKTENVLFDNKTAGITLAGTLTIPQGSGQFPAVVLISGSGAQNRDEELFGHKPFLLLADQLTRNGIAVLRYDDRGFGKSTGNYPSATIQDFATDALSAITYLATRQEIDNKKIGIAGHSEGGSIAYILAGGDKNQQIAFIISMAGPTVKGETVIAEQRRLISHAMGTSTDAFEFNERLVAAATQIANDHPLDYIIKNIKQLTSRLQLEAPNPLLQKDAYSSAIMQLASPEIQSLMRYDPTDDIKAILCPILAITGTKDIQVPVSMSLEPLRTKAYSSKNITIKQYEGLNHLFQHSSTGMPTEYLTIEETISPEVLSDITTWIKLVTK